MYYLCIGSDTFIQIVYKCIINNIIQFERKFYCYYQKAIV